jgi:acetyl/propionyl-CoA carboxylase alpha subunit
MIKRVLVAERGPLATTIHLALQAAGVETVAVHGDLDADYIEKATFATYVPSLDRIEDLVSAAVDGGCDALHPGCGALAENPELARGVAQANMLFLGPLPEQIAALADRWTTREIAIAAAVPVIPGSAPILNLGDLEDPISRLGFPLWVKDAWGLVAEKFERQDHLVAEVGSRVHSGQKVWVEAHVRGARHLVVTVVGDESGEVVPLGVRERAIRGGGKLTIDQYPAPCTDALQKGLEDAAVAFAEAVRYRGVGSVSFLVDSSGAAWCIGLRPRIQIGTLLNDAVLGVRMPELQLRVARGEPIGWDRDDLANTGAALGLRIRAREKGVLQRLEVPDGEFHTHAIVGEEVRGLVGVLVITAPTRHAAVVRASGALRRIVLEGLETDIEEHLVSLAQPSFWEGVVEET